MIINSYPKVYNLGHAAIAEILLDEVLVEEKIDGSQLSFGKFNSPDGFYLAARSRGAVINTIAPDNMFKKGIETALDLFDSLNEGWVYRGEYLAKPKHNTLCYNRVPAKNFILFDVNTGLEQYLSYDEKQAEARRLGLEVVPIIYQGRVESIDHFRSFLDSISILGGQKIEGVVVKNYSRFSRDSKAMMGKFVSESFKEVHQGDWKDRNPSSKDFIALIANKYTSSARWEKSVQHLRESGQLEDSPRDIGHLIHAVPKDILEECQEEIKDELFKFAWKQVSRCVTRGLPEWYKEKLLQRQFTGIIT